MQRRDLLKQAGVGLSVMILSGYGWCAPVAKVSSSGRPNIIVILADDLGYNDLSCYGATKLNTARIDSLATEGIRFTDAHAPAAVCQPTRYAILAGRYYWRSKQPIESSYYLHAGEVTLPAVLQKAGYSTACIGKWHLGFCNSTPDYNKELKPGPLEAGFDYFFGLPRSHNEPPFVFVEDYKVVGLEPTDPIKIIANADIPADAPMKGWSHGISVGAKVAHDARPGERIDMILAQKTVEYIAKQSGEKPFFIYLPFQAPHVPIAPAKEYHGTSQAADYGDFIQQLDACVGQVLDVLKEKNLEKNTLVIFTSDNGGLYIGNVLKTGHRCNGSLLGQKTDAWDGGHKVPFIARWPGKIAQGKTSDRLLSLSDLMATILAAAGVSMPAGAGEDSMNQFEVLCSPDVPAVRTEMIYQGIFGLALRSGDWVFLPKKGSLGMTAHQEIRWGQSYASIGLKNSEYDDKGILLTDAQPAQLYNVRVDPGQHQNLYSQHPEVVAKLSARLKGLTSEK